MKIKAEITGFVRRDSTGRGAGKDGADHWFEVRGLAGASLCLPVFISDTARARAVPGINRQLTEEDFELIARPRLEERLREGFVPMAEMTVEDYDSVLAIYSDVFPDIASRALRNKT